MILKDYLCKIASKKPTALQKSFQNPREKIPQLDTAPQPTTTKENVTTQKSARRIHENEAFIDEAEAVKGKTAQLTQAPAKICGSAILVSLQECLKRQNVLAL